MQEAIIKDPYHTLLWGGKKVYFFPQKKQIGETFTTHINLQLVLTLSGTGVKNVRCSTGMKVFTPDRMYMDDA